MSKKLVIVESPAKARTLARILGSSYNLKASLGHIRDLPRSRIGVDIDDNFAPKYVVPRAKIKLVNELKKAARSASAVYLATDPDREGEAIAWHLAEVTQPDKVPFHRVTFHEITEEAVKNAFQHPRTLDMKLVDAQQARRVLDRLVGYKLSPLLWQKIRRGLSAGRVQSVAVKIIADREQEIQKFVPVEYWNIKAELSKKVKKATFSAILVSFSDGTKLEIHNQEEATRIKNELEKAAYSVAEINVKKVTRQPAPPFITSTLQQEAWRKLHFTAKQTMAVAQQLYEGLDLGEEGSVGLITYMRTDSTQVASSAIAETREFIKEKYGTQYLPAKARVFRSRVMGAQEAHEAIRPTRTRREPSQIKKYLNASQFKLYELIWKRMVASQMAAAVFQNTIVDIDARLPQTSYRFRTSSSVNIFPGFITLYIEGKDEASEEEKGSLPELTKGEDLKLIRINPEQRFTQPPPRFTEATLIKELEQWGIGRPSTYAPILSTIQEREYVTKANGSFQPTELGIMVNDLLSQNFPEIVDVKFTANMENKLDAIANKNTSWVNVVQRFYTPFAKDVQEASERIERIKIADEPTDEVCPQCGKPMVVKTGRFGKFIACSGYPDCKYTKSYQVKLGVKCPQCGGELIRRMNKKKRVFYGCSKYPDCQFATNFKPLTEPCPQCGGLLTQRGAKQTKCFKCGYQGRLAQD